MKKSVLLGLVLGSLMVSSAWANNRFVARINLGTGGSCANYGVGGGVENYRYHDIHRGGMWGNPCIIPHNHDNHERYLFRPDYTSVNVTWPEWYIASHNNVAPLRADYSDIWSNNNVAGVVCHAHSGRFGGNFQIQQQFVESGFPVYDLQRRRELTAYAQNRVMDVCYNYNNRYDSSCYFTYCESY